VAAAITIEVILGLAVTVFSNVRCHAAMKGLRVYVAGSRMEALLWNGDFSEMASVE